MENLKNRFSTIYVEPGLGNTGLTLDRYFERDAQLCDALPDRLRGLIDLKGVADVEVRATPEKGATNKARWYAPASRIVEHIWHRALNTSGRALGSYKNVVRIDDTTGALDIRDGAVPPDLDVNTLFAAQSKPRGASPKVTFLTIDRFDIIVAPGEVLPRQVTAALMLAANVAFDQGHGTWNGISTPRTGYEGIFANSEYQLPGASSSTFLAWPLPAGYSLPFYAALSLRWKEALREVTQNRVGDRDAPAVDADTMAKRFLWLVISLLWAKGTEDHEEIPADWSALADKVIKLLQLGGTRTRAWAIRRAGMLAAPEYGLSSRGANAWLSALRDAAGSERWQALREALSAERRERMAVGTSKVERALAEIDKRFSKHAWGRLVEDGGTKTTEDSSVFEDILRNIPPAPEDEDEDEDSYTATSDDSESAIGAREKVRAPVAKVRQALAERGIETPMTAAMTTALSKRSAAAFRTALVNKAEVFKNATRERAPLLVGIWNLAIENKKSLKHLIQTSHRSIVIAQPHVEYPNAEAGASYHWVRNDGLAIDLRIPAKLGLEVTVEQGRLERGADLARYVYEFIWDAAMDKAILKDPASPFPEWSPLVLVAMSIFNTKRVRWPAPCWPRFYDEDRMRRCWASVVKLVRGTPMREMDEVAKLDIVAMQFFDVCSKVMLGMDVEDVDGESYVDASRWEDAIWRFGTSLRPSSLDRVAPYNDWLQRAILLAAPESGTSPAFADVMTGVYDGLKRRASQDYVKPEVLHRLRLERLQQADLPNAEELLQSIDAKIKATSHPWSKLLLPT